MSEEEKILRTIRYCANDYMKQEDGIQCFEWGDLWVLNEYIENIKQENKQLKEVIEEVREFINEYTLDYENTDGSIVYLDEEDISELEEILDKVKGSE